MSNVHTPSSNRSSAARASETIPEKPEFEFQLRLYVTGATQHSMLAVKNIKHLCEEYLSGRYNLEIVDVYQQPAETKNKRIIATPTLLKLAPLPRRYLVGDMSDTKAVLLGLGISE